MQSRRRYRQRNRGRSRHLPGGRFANENYAHLWDTINGEGAWAANPWVWCVTFSRVEAA